MCYIGYASLSKEAETNYIEMLESQFDDIEVVDKDKMMDTKNNLLDAIIIQDDQNRFVGNVCEAIIHYREHTNALIWVVSKKITKVDRSVYLRLGANGVFSSGFDPEELSVVINNFLTRYISNSLTNPIQSTTEAEALDDRFRLQPNSFSVVVEGREISLTKLEFQIISYLYERAKEVVTYEEIYRKVWKTNEKSKFYRVSNMIFHLRKKLEKDELQPQYIKTVRSRGYLLNV